MPEPYYFAGSVPANYDKYLGPYLFEPYAIDLAGRLANDNCHHVLELACGTGRVTNHLLSVLGANGTLTATDLNPEMLRVAEAKIKDERVQWKVVDAQELPFKKASFDHVICQFGVMFFPDRHQAFREAFRVLLPGGKFIFSTWGPVEKNDHSAFIQQVVTDVCKDDAPDFLTKGPYSFFQEDAMQEALAVAGFQHIEIQQVIKTATYPGINEYLSGFLDGSPLSAFIDRKPPGTREMLKERATQQFAESGATTIQSSMMAFVCTGVKPTSKLNAHVL